MSTDSKHVITLSLTTAFIAGVGLNQQFGIISWQVALLLISAYIVLRLSRALTRNLTAVILLTVLVGGFYSVYITPHPDADNITNFMPLTNVQGEGTVITEPRWVDKTRLRLTLLADRVSIATGKSFQTHGRVLVHISPVNPEVLALKIGDRIRTTASKLVFPKKPTNPGGFDYGRYLHIKNIQAVQYLSASQVIRLSEPSSNYFYGFLRTLNNLKQSFLKSLDPYLSDEQLILLGGMVFGDDAVPMDKAMKSKFIDSGLIHIISASGFNLTVVSLGLMYILTFIRVIPYRLSVCLGIVTMVLYSCFTGFPPSILRASLMLGFILVGKLINRDINTLRLLAIACAILVTVNQTLLQDIGFQLSFITTLGLILMVEPLIDKMTFLPKSFASIVVVPAVAQLWASPVIFYHFHRFSSYAVLSNILVLPIVPFITVIGFMCFGLYSVCPWFFLLAKPMSWLLTPFLNYIILVAGFFAHSPFSILYVPSLSFFQCLILYLLMCLMVFILKAQINFLTGLRYGAVLLVMYLGMVVYGDDSLGKLKVAFLDVGQGDCIVIKSPKGRIALVDTGGNPYKQKSYAERVIIPYLEYIGSRHVDVLAATHPDSDHIKGIPDILNEIPVKLYIDSGFSSKHQDYLSILQTIIRKKIPYSIVDRGDVIHLDDETTLTVLSPEYPDEFTGIRNNTDDNSNSLVLKLSYKDFSLLLTADAEADVLNTLEDDLTTTVLKIPHHGSFNAVNTPLVKKILPQVAVIQVGKNNYGHPHPSVTDLLTRYNVKIFRNDLNGAVEIISDGRTYKVRPYKV